MMTSLIWSFLYHHTLLEKYLYYSGYLRISSYQLGEGQQ